MGSRLFGTAFIGGKKVWGPFPFFDAAYLDNRTTTGLGWNRYAGDASLYGGLELDVFLARLRKVVPGELGISFFGDVGRVYLEGEDSGSWHASYGAGLFYAPFRRTSLYGLKVGKDEDRLFVVFEARMIGFDY
jgi:hypothetical protein